MESDGPPIFLILGFVLAVPVVSMISIGVSRALDRRRQQKLCDLLEPMAASQRGQVIKGQPGGFPSMSFSHGKREFSVFFRPGGKHSPPWTHVHAPLSLPRDIRLSVFQDSIAYRAFKLVGGQDIEVGYEKFDRAFVIRGNDDARARAVLRPEIQERLLELTGQSVSLSLSQQKLELVVSGIPASEDELVRLLKPFTLLLEAVDQNVY
jgi:uncharacterized protein DUF3137